MKNLLKILLVISKIIFCLFITVFLVMHTFIGIAFELNYQSVIFLLYSIFIIIGLWGLCFFKTKKEIRFLYIFFLIGYFFVHLVLSDVKNSFDLDYCIDTGYCSEGLKVFGGVISQSFCEKENGKWDKKRKECDIRIELRTCENQGCKWIYPKNKCSCKIIKNW